MSVDASTLEQYTGKQVVLHRIVEGGGIDELNGKVESASEHGMAFKESGKRDFILIEPHEIEEITEAEEKPKTLGQKKLQPIAAGSMRQHLLDRHAFARSVVNPMTDAEAVAAHDKIEHKDLGHRHLTDEEVAKAAEKKASEAKASE